MRPFRSGLSCPVESGCPVSLRQRLGDEELDECVGAEDGLPRSGDGVGLSDFPRLMRLWPGMNTAVDPSAAVFTAGVVEVELLADVTPEGEDEAEVDGDETSGGESASSSESKGSEGSTASSLASSTPSTELSIPAACLSQPQNRRLLQSQILDCCSRYSCRCLTAVDILDA